MRHGLTTLRALAALVGLLLVAALTACAPATGAGDRFRIYATTGYLADIAKNIAPDAEVTTMVGPGADPHTFQPSTRDIQKIQDADLVLWNGLHLEAHMVDQLMSLGNKQLAVGEHVPPAMLLDWPETDDQGNALHDPHIWNSPDAWVHVTRQVADALSAANSDSADAYRSAADHYIDAIKSADAENRELLASVPKQRRVLITGHDAFNYFGKTYGFDVHATDFVSTTAQLSPEQLSELADLIADRKIPVIFHDNQANPQAIKSLKEAVQSRGWNVEVSDEELFADSLGADPGVDTYLGVMRHNATAVANALGGNDAR